MEDLRGITPCSSLAVHSAIQIGTAGGIWGSCLGPHQARKRGLTGTSHAFFVAKSIGKLSFQCGNRWKLSLGLVVSVLALRLVGGVCTLIHCGVQRYRRQNDWVNALVGGGGAGAVVAAGTFVTTRTRDWRQLVGIAGLVAVCSAAADFSKTF